MSLKRDFATACYKMRVSLMSDRQKESPTVVMTMGLFVCLCKGIIVVPPVAATRITYPDVKHELP